jgi:hypothetical protein
MILRDSFKGSSTCKFHTKMTRRINTLKQFQQRRSLSQKFEEIVRSNSIVNKKSFMHTEQNEHEDSSKRGTLRYRNMMSVSLEKIGDRKNKTGKLKSRLGEMY